MFRNVRTEPRKFQFRSRHLPQLGGDWMKRKQRVEGAVEDESESQDRKIRFRSESVNRKSRRKSQVLSARWAMMRAALIAAVLVWLAFQGLKWVEESDFSNVLKWMEDA